MLRVASGRVGSGWLCVKMMSDTHSSEHWKQIWDRNAQTRVPDFVLDRGFSPRSRHIEALSERELIAFIDPKPSDVLLDAGCGTGTNILRLHSKVKKLIGIDYSPASIERCTKRLQIEGIHNASLHTGSVTDLFLKDEKVDRIICLSVLQYLDQTEVRRTLKAFAAMLTPGGVAVFHVKNRSSLYWVTLLAAKKLKRLLLRRETLTYEVRPFDWYITELRLAGFTVQDFNAFNVFSIEMMPKPVMSLLQGLELKYHRAWLFRRSFVRRHGADLKIKAVLNAGPSKQ
jgi:2-polyprenyl-3-methyl-5-hydroxy-6-metoxy-1,4-benzoquinol methylase